MKRLYSLVAILILTGVIARALFAQSSILPGQNQMYNGSRVIGVVPVTPVSASGTPIVTKTYSSGTTLTAYSSGYTLLIPGVQNTSIYVGNAASLQAPVYQVSVCGSATSGTILQFQFGNGTNAGQAIPLPTTAGCFNVEGSQFPTAGLVNASFGVSLSGPATLSFNIPYSQH